MGMTLDQPGGPSVTTGSLNEKMATGGGLGPDPPLLALNTKEGAGTGAHGHV